MYRFLFWRDAKLEGYLVLRNSARKDWLWITIVDWEGTSEHVLSDLLGAATAMGDFEDLGLWAASLSPTHLAVLSAHGFKATGEPPSISSNTNHVIVCPIREKTNDSAWSLGGRNLLDLANWDLRMIYSDAY